MHLVRREHVRALTDAETEMYNELFDGNVEVLVVQLESGGEVFELELFPLGLEGSYGMLINTITSYTNWWA